MVSLRVFVGGMNFLGMLFRIMAASSGIGGSKAIDQLYLTTQHLNCLVMFGQTTLIP